MAETPTPTPTPTPTDSTTFDVIIIGAGIMGSCAAYEISKRQKKVLLLEQFDLLHSLGSSHGSSRTIRATYPESYYPPMALASSLLWQSAQSSSNSQVLTPTSHLDLLPPSSPPLHSPSPPLLLPLHPSFTLPSTWSSLSSPLGGVLNPSKSLSMFHSLSLLHGALILPLSPVHSISLSAAGIRVSISDGRAFFAPKCVVTAGAWTKKLVKRVTGRELPIQPLHTVIWYWKIKEGFETEMRGLPTFASYGKPYIYGTPAVEFPGLIKVSVHGGWRCDPDCREWGLDWEEEMVGKVGEWIEGVLPGKVETGMGPVVRERCMYSMTPDEDFVIDFLGGEFGKDVVVAGGFSGHGFKMAPLVGKMVAEMVVDGEMREGERIGVDMRVFGLARFEGMGRGNVKEFGDQVNFHGSC